MNVPLIKINPSDIDEFEPLELIQYIKSGQRRSVPATLDSLEEYSIQKRIDNFKQGMMINFPQSQFSVEQRFDGVGHERRRFLVFLNLNQLDLKAVSPEFLSEAEDYFWIWGELLNRVQDCASKLGMSFNYSKENRERMIYIMRFYEMSLESELLQKDVYQLEIKCIKSEPQRLDQGLHTDKFSSSESLCPGFLITVDLSIPKDGVIFLEKIRAFVNGVFSRFHNY